MTIEQLSNDQLEELKQNVYWNPDIECDPDISDEDLTRLTYEELGGCDFGLDDFGCTAGRYDREIEVKLKFDEYQIEKVESWYGKMIDDCDFQGVIEKIIDEAICDCKPII